MRVALGGKVLAGGGWEEPRVGASTMESCVRVTDELTEKGRCADGGPAEPRARARPGCRAGSFSEPRFQLKLLDSQTRGRSLPVTDASPLSRGFRMLNGRGRARRDPGPGDRISFFYLPI